VSTLSDPIVADIRDLSVRYTLQNGGAVCAIEGINLRIRRGEIVGILGESGSGKSTLAAAMVRLLSPNADCKGSVQFDGQDLLAMNEKQLLAVRGARLALIQQDPAVSLNPVIRVGEQISEVLRAHLSLPANERKRRAERLLEEVGFENPKRIYGLYPHQLSGGQRQRVVIAQAMACRPELIIADEPTSKLDSKLQAQILALISGIVRRHRAAFLLITHDPSILAGFADRIVVMYGGRIIEDGSAQEILRRPVHPYTRSLIALAMRDPQTFSPEASHLVGCLKYDA
jgi:ABC-type glutathione transport system ATPase component